MNDLEAIEQRKSRRTYLGAPIISENAKILRGLIDELNAKYELSMALIENGKKAFDSIGKSYGMFKGVRSLIALQGLKNDENLKEKLGYCGEMIALKATKLGLGTCWVGGTFDRKSDVFKVSENEALICVITIGNVPAENTIKEKLVYKMTHRKTKPAEDFFASDTRVPDWFIQGIEAVQKAPSAMNSQKVKFEYKNGTASAFVPDNYGADLIDLGIAKLHFELAAGGQFSLGNYGTFSKNEL